MKKYLILSIVALVLMLPITGASTILSTNEAAETPSNMSYEEVTHTVFVEYASLTTCGPCVTASAQLYSIYNSGDLDYKYVTLVADEGNYRITGRVTALGVVAVPDVFFDGGYKRIKGSQGSELPYRNAITQSGERAVPDIDIDVDVTWLGGGRLKIKVTVVNNEVDEFKGHIRTYVVEKESRWNDNSGNPYHYAALDIPIDKDINVVMIEPQQLGDTYTFSKTWFGSLYGFGDITKENTIVIAAVYDGESDYAVQTASAEPTGSSSNTLSTNSLFLQLLGQDSHMFSILRHLLGFQ